MSLAGLALVLALGLLGPLAAHAAAVLLRQPLRLRLRPDRDEVATKR